MALQYCIMLHPTIKLPAPIVLDSGMGANQIDTDENTPVHLAIKNDDTELTEAMKCLLDHKRYWHYYCKQ